MRKGYKNNSTFIPKCFIYSWPKLILTKVVPPAYPKIILKSLGPTFSNSLHILCVRCQVSTHQALCTQQTTHGGLIMFCLKPQQPRSTPELQPGPRFALCQLVGGNLIKQKFIKEYAACKHNINQNNKVLN